MSSTACLCPVSAALCDHRLCYQQNRQFIKAAYLCTDWREFQSENWWFSRVCVFESKTELTVSPPHSFQAI